MESSFLSLPPMPSPLELLQEHKQQPKNLGKIVGCDAVGDVGSIVVGDALRFFLRIEGDTITEAKFQVFGAADMISAASVLSELVVGKSIAEARRLRARHICEHLGGLPRFELPGQVWALDALNVALDAHQGFDTPYDDDLDALVCRCHGVSEQQIRDAISEDSCDDIDKVAAMTFATTGCASCKVDVQKILDDVLQPEQKSSVGGQAAGPQVGRIPMMHKINTLVAQEFAPELSELQSQVELWDLTTEQVIIKLTGAIEDAGDARDQFLDRFQRRIQDEVASHLQVIVAAN